MYAEEITTESDIVARSDPLTLLDRMVEQEDELKASHDRTAEELERLERIEQR